MIELTLLNKPEPDVFDAAGSKYLSMTTIFDIKTDLPTDVFFKEALDVFHKLTPEENLYVFPLLTRVEGNTWRMSIRYVKLPMDMMEHVDQVITLGLNNLNTRKV